MLALSTLIEIAGILVFFFVSLADTFDEFLGLFDSGIALVLVLISVVEEAWVVLEMVGLAIQEGVKLLEVRGIFSLAVWLRSMVSMTVDAAKVILSVGHVLAIIDLIEFSLAISDLPCVGCTNVLILTEVSTNQRSVVPRVVLADQHLGEGSATDHGETSPAESPFANDWIHSDN